MCGNNFWLIFEYYETLFNNEKWEFYPKSRIERQEK